MTDYAIGDVQGCYDGLLKLLDLIHFDDKIDRLWFVGDLVNRGPQSLEVLRFIKALPQKAQITLGNHDLHLLRNLYATPKKHHADDTLQAILNAPDKDALGTWLRHQPLLIHDARLNVVMSHAGIAPIWDLAQAKRYALEAQQILIGDNYQQALQALFDDTPDMWSETLEGFARFRCIINYLTRMRWCAADGRLQFTHIPHTSYPWFATPLRKAIKPCIVFGHWSALKGLCPIPGIEALDTGYVWGGALTALRLCDKKRFSLAYQVT
ncbi:MAG: diadenosine tetraphosphatase [Legionellaceae bacterium]|nr:diadenosine tetraphosphatase [Legionellaceae bacterium]HCA88912.1 diadenosine tetraphosphatase [Legionellales bacterium]|tara:strand:+ start:4024 stop:4824 length:801 start_codon:yes stop_codon:yes gene_type:complete